VAAAQLWACLGLSQLLLAVCGKDFCCCRRRSSAFVLLLCKLLQDGFLDTVGPSHAYLWIFFLVLH
jgi:hypothetical protein